MTTSQNPSERVPETPPATEPLQEQLSSVTTGATETQKAVEAALLRLSPEQRKQELRRRIDAKEILPSSLDPDFIARTDETGDMVEQRDLQHEKGGTQAIVIPFDTLGVLSSFRYVAPDGSVITLRTDYDEESEQLMVWRVDEQGREIDPNPEVIGEDGAFIILPEELGNLPKRAQL